MPDLNEKNDILWQGLVRASILTATTQKLYRYITLADQKAMGLIIVNSAIIPFAMNGFDNHPDFKVPATLAIITGTTSIMMAIICIFPKRKAGKQPKGQRNLLHFSEISTLSEDEFLAEFNPIYNDGPEPSRARAQILVFKSVLYRVLYRKCTRDINVSLSHMGLTKPLRWT